MFTFENIKHNMKTFRKIGCLLLIATFSFPCFAKKRIYLKGKKVCQNSHLLFYAQSPDFHKLGLCYNLKILYL